VTTIKESTMGKKRAAADAIVADWVSQIKGYGLEPHSGCMVIGTVEEPRMAFFTAFAADITEEDRAGAMRDLAAMVAGEGRS
jgi:hypothetical protein